MAAMPTHADRADRGLLNGKWRQRWVEKRATRRDSHNGRLFCKKGDLQHLQVPFFAFATDCGPRLDSSNASTSLQLS